VGSDEKRVAPALRPNSFQIFVKFQNNVSRLILMLSSCHLSPDAIIIDEASLRFEHTKARARKTHR
jgi:hypothetical protein